MECEHCQRRFATYDGLYHHVGRKHGLGPQAGMMRPELYERAERQAYMTATPSLGEDRVADIFNRAAPRE
jgi:hypothetical protein